MYAVVPAYNEAPTVGGVVRVLRDSGVFEDVVVVDDGSSDDTVAQSEAAGAVVISSPQNLGKGGAMLFAYEALRDVGDDDRLAFFDADLLGLQPRHVVRMAELGARGYDMVCMLRDRGPVSNALQSIGPLITGERIVRRWLLEDLPVTCWKGYCIETALNDAVERRGGRTATIVADGVQPRTKLDKTGLVAGMRGQLRMVRQILDTRRALQSSEGLTCEL